jgi:predicted nucleotidyltransferase
MTRDGHEAEHRIARLAAAEPGLRLLALFGSRARGDVTERSDWDLGYLADPVFDPDAFRVRLVLALESERVDLVDLERASGLVRFRAARDGRALFESGADVFDRFQVEAATFWCDAERVLNDAYEDLLGALER